MDLKRELLLDQSYEQAEKIAWYIFDHTDLLPTLFDLFWGCDSRITQRASLVIIICTDWKPKLIKPYVEEMILKLNKSDISNAVKRNTVRILAQFPIPKHMEGIITEICFNYLNNASEAIAVKVFSMTILERMVEKHPDLKEELIVSIEMGMEFGSAGYKNRGGKILERLKKYNHGIKMIKKPNLP
jgi:hypothetical protein